MNFSPFRLVLLISLLCGVSGFAQDTPPKQTGPERWEADIAKFEAQEKANPSPKDALLFVGSSSIRMWKLEESFPDRKTVNRGFGGSTLADSIHYFDRLVTPLAPKAIIVYAGDNDIKNGMTADEVVADFKTLAGLAAEKLPGTPFVFIAIKPSVSRWSLWPTMKTANERIASWCTEHEGFFYADIAAPMLADVEAGQPPKDTYFLKDGLHMTPEGYAVWKMVIDTLLKEAPPKKAE